MEQWRPKIRNTWRPPDWDKFKADYFKERGYLYPPEFEAGADALFRALVLHHGKYIAGMGFPYVTKDGLESGIELKDGWQITIPQDEIVFNPDKT